MPVPRTTPASQGGPGAGRRGPGGAGAHLRRWRQFSSSWTKLRSSEDIAGGPLAAVVVAVEALSLALPESQFGWGHHLLGLPLPSGGAAGPQGASLGQALAKLSTLRSAGASAGAGKLQAPAPCQAPTRRRSPSLAPPSVCLQFQGRRQGDLPRGWARGRIHWKFHERRSSRRPGASESANAGAKEGRNCPDFALGGHPQHREHPPLPVSGPGGGRRREEDGGQG